MEEAPLRRVGRYDLLEVIGRGGAAVVYLAHQTDLQRNVALKELAPFHAADQTFAQRFVEESRLAGAMSHSNIVTVHEFFEHSGVPYIAMEYLPNGSLRQYVDKLSLAQIAGVLEAVLAGLSHGASHGVVHRDLKPENLLVAADGRVKIADFGVARAFNNAATRNVVTVTGSTIGTPAYMSPEQALGGDMTPACDLYSLGVIAWELLVGHVPFRETDAPVAVLYRHVHEEIPPVRSEVPEVDERVDRWVTRMLAKRPEERYPSAEEAWYELEDVVLELLGPRWRREARLAVDDAPTVEREPLTPAPFTGPSAAQRTMTGPVATPDATPDPVPAQTSPETSSPRTTIAPRSLPRPSYTTVMRSARRHRDAGSGEGAKGAPPWRRRLLVAGIVVAMAAAATAGVLIAGNGTHHSGPTAAQRRAAQQAAARRVAAQKAERRQQQIASTNHRLASIVGDLGPRRTRDIVRLDNARTPASQIADADRVRNDYRSAAKQVVKLKSGSPAAAPLARTLGDVGDAYGRLAAAVHSGSEKRYKAAEKAVKSTEGTLRGEVNKL